MPAVVSPVMMPGKAEKVEKSFSRQPRAEWRRQLKIVESLIEI